MYIYAYIYMYKYVYIYIHIYMYIHMYVYICFVCAYRDSDARSILTELISIDSNWRIFSQRKCTYSNPITVWDLGVANLHSVAGCEGVYKCVCCSCLAKLTRRKGVLRFGKNQTINILCMRENNKAHDLYSLCVSFPAQNGECFGNVRVKCHSLDDREHGCRI